MADDRPPLESFVKRPPLESFVKKPDEGGGFWSSAGDFFKSIPGGVARGVQEFGRLEQAGRQQFLGITPESGEMRSTLGSLVTGQKPQPMGAGEAEGLAPHQRPGAGGDPLVSAMPQPQGAAGRFGEALGSAAGNPLSYLGPGSMAQKVGAAAGGALGGQAGAEVGGTPGAIAGGMLGGFAGGGVGNIGARLAAKPSAANLPDSDPVHKALMNTLQHFKVQPSAGDFRNSNMLQQAEKVGGLIGGGNVANKTRAEKQLTQAALKLIGEPGDVVMPATLGTSGTAKDSASRIGSMFDRAEGMIKVNHDQKFQDKINAIKVQAAQELTAPEMEKLGKLLDQFNPTTSPGTLWFANKKTGTLEMKGGAYKEFTSYKSLMQRLRREGGGVGDYAGRLRDALEEQLDRSARGPKQKEGVALIREARKQNVYRDIIMDSVQKTGKNKGLLDPSKLAKNAANLDDSMELAHLAEAAGGVLTSPKYANIFGSSHDTGQGLIREVARGGAGAVGAGLGFALGGPWGALAGSVAPGGFGYAVNSPAVQRYLKNPHLGYTKKEAELRAAVGAVLGRDTGERNERKKPVRQKRPGAIYDE